MNVLLKPDTFVPGAYKSIARLGPAIQDNLWVRLRFPGEKQSARARGCKGGHGPASEREPGILESDDEMCCAQAAVW
ncbi:hypothetical protein BH11GEM2_BH11GEM2_32590 [soil metagenome]